MGVSWMHTRNDANLLKRGEKARGAAGRSSFWPTKIDRSHHLKKDQYHQEHVNFFSIRQYICTVIYSFCENFLAIIFGFLYAFQNVLSGLMEKLLGRHAQ